ncbi:hypothetical protein J5500_02130 [Candidatus Saccharibacteria bacterium]|nr:hypothetical protein [Candidatus Saccharibacteria bacterium]
MSEKNNNATNDNAYGAYANFIADVFQLPDIPVVSERLARVIMYTLQFFFGERAVTIVSLRYGFDSCETMTKREISEKLGINYSVVCLELKHVSERLRQTKIHRERIMYHISGEKTQLLALAEDMFKPDKVSIYDSRLSVATLKYLAAKDCSTLADVHEKVSLPADHRYDDLNKLMDAFYPSENILGKTLNDHLSEQYTRFMRQNFGEFGFVPHSMRYVVEEKLDRVWGSHAAVIRLYYGLKGSDSYSVDQICDLLDAPRTRVAHFFHSGIYSIKRNSRDYDEFSLLAMSYGQLADKYIETKRQLDKSDKRLAALEHAGLIKKEVRLDTSVDDLGLSARARNCLLRAGLMTVEDVLAIPDKQLARVRNMGPKTLAEIKTTLNDFIEHA